MITTLVVHSSALKNEPLILVKIRSPSSACKDRRASTSSVYFGPCG